MKISNFWQIYRAHIYGKFTILWEYFQGIRFIGKIPCMRIVWSRGGPIFGFFGFSTGGNRQQM
jgi:hypothetical protein